jgi:hypothetical protein
MASQRWLVAATLFGCLAAGADAALDLAAQNGDRIASALDPAAEVESFRIACPAGATISVKAKAAKGGPQLRVRLSGPSDAPVAEDIGTKAALKKAPAATTGTYTIDVSSFDGVTAGTYSLSIAWKSPAKFGGSADLTPAEEATLTFAADAGAKAKFRAKPGKRSHAIGSLVEVTGPNSFVGTLGQAGAGASVLPFAGEYVLRYANGADVAGAVSVSVTLTPPKKAKRSLSLAASSVPGNAKALLAGVIGEGGGSLVAEGEGPLSGASVTVPPGALLSATSILLGSADPILTTLPGVSAGPAIFIGPEGLTFEDGLEATVTIPYDPALFPDGVDSLAILTRDADGNLVAIEGAVIDVVAHTVTFPTSHFSAFGVRREFGLTETARLVDSAATAGEDFGAAVSVHADTIAIGAPHRDLDAATPDVGAVVTFRRLASGWSEDTSFRPPGPASQDGFGTSVWVYVSAARDTLLVGAPGRKGFTGAPTGSALAYERDPGGAWGASTELIAPQAAGGDRAGVSVAFDGDTAIVGAPGDSLRQPGAGAAHVYVRTFDSWTHEARLEAPTPLTGDEFGSSVAIVGDTAVVAAAGAGNAGALFVFRRSVGRWTFDGRIGAPNAVKGQRFGAALAFDKSTITAASDFSATDGFGAGAVYVFPDSPPGFPLEASLTSADPLSTEDPASDLFGSGLALRGDVLIAGAPTRDLPLGAGAPLASAGQAFVFERTGGAWRLAARLRGTSGDKFPIAAGDLFGVRTAFDGTTIVVGATGEKSLPGQAAGAAYVFVVGGR